MSPGICAPLSQIYLHIQGYSHVTAQLLLMLLHVSAASHSHLQGITSVGRQVQRATQVVKYKWSIIYTYVNYISILQFIFDIMCSTLNVFSKIVVPYDCCCWQSKYLRALTPIFQLVGNKLMCVRQLCALHTALHTITL